MVVLVMRRVDDERPSYHLVSIVSTTDVSRAHDKVSGRSVTPLSRGIQPAVNKHTFGSKRLIDKQKLVDCWKEAPLPAMHAWLNIEAGVNNSPPNSHDQSGRRIDSSYELMQHRLGTGHFSTVRLALKRETRIRVAVKVVLDDSTNMKITTAADWRIAEALVRS